MRLGEVVLKSRCQAGSDELARETKVMELRAAVEADSQVNWRLEWSTYAPWMFDGSINSAFALHVHTSD